MKQKIDDFFYQLTFAPFVAAAFFYLLALSIFINFFDSYNVVQFGTIGFMLIAIAIAGFLYWNIFNIPLIISIVGGGFLIVSGYKIYSYYFLLHPIERYKSLWLFESQYSQLIAFLAKGAMLAFVLIGLIYLISGIQQRLKDE